MEALAIAGSVANIVVAAIAALALFLAWRQIGVSRELSALEAYENYHSMCLQHSEFSSGKVDFASFDAAKRQQYQVYVLYTLMMDERIFALFPKDAGWIFSIKDDIEMHWEYIASPYFSDHLANQQWKILPLIQEVLAEKAAATP
jgi:hypothetical protein